MALDSDTAISGYGHVKSNEISSHPVAHIKVEATVIFPNDEAPKPKCREPVLTPATPSAPKPRAPSRTTRRTTKPRDSKQAPMTAFLQSPAASKPASVEETAPAKSGSSPEEHINSSTSAKNDEETSATNASVECIKIKEEDIVNDAASTSNKQMDSKEMAAPLRKESNVEKARKELSLGDIKSKLTRSARLAELKASLSRYDAGRDKLKQIEQAKQSLQCSGPPKPQLTQFNSIELEVPASPTKSPMKSPLKSPLKSPAASRSPAFQRYAALAQPGVPALPLPYSYRHLAELFRCMEQAISMFYNRRELVTFEKLQPAVQELSRKTFTLTHVARITTVFPEAYVMKQEKTHSYGMLSKNDKYQLVIIPSLKSATDVENNSMTPTMLLERKRIFYNSLLNIVKKHHEEFLQSLDPPMVVPVGALTRWHPEFAVDQVPEITPSELPQPPHLDKCNSAKDVLARARQMVSCNPRMEKALESVAQANNSCDVPTVNVTVVDASSPAPVDPPSSPMKSMQISAALKGLPKALVEKIRAKQAARALEAMTRTSAQDKEAAQYARLPDIARILRNVFVAEKKGSLQLDFVLEKVGNSYRTKLTQKELDEHIRLLSKIAPSYVSFEFLLKTDYLKLDRKVDLNRVLSKLNDLANKKLGSC